MSDLIHYIPEKGLRHASGPVQAKHPNRYIHRGLIESINETWTYLKAFVCWYYKLTGIELFFNNTKESSMSLIICDVIKLNHFTYILNRLMKFLYWSQPQDFL